MSLQAIQNVFVRRSIRSPRTPSLDLNAFRDDLRRDGTREAIEKEFLETERAYVKRIETMVEAFLIPLQTWVQELIADDDTAEENPLFDKQTCRLLFSNIEEILRVHKYILEALEDACSRSHEAIAQVFVTTAPFLQQYLLYYTNYGQASEHLRKLSDQSKDFRIFVKACEYQPRCKGEKLPSLLIQPVQRLPRYRLLLETLLKNTPTGTSEHRLLQQAIEKVSQVLNKLNEEIARRQEREQVKELASRFGVENDVHMIAPHRQLIKEGPLVKISLKWGARQERYVVLMNDMLIYGKQSFGGEKFSSPHEVELLQAIVLVSEGNDTHFVLVTPPKSIYFVAPSAQDRDAWVQSFQKAFQSTNRTERGKLADLIMEPDGSARLSATSPPDRRWLRRKIAMTYVADDGTVSRREYVVPDLMMNTVRGIFPYGDIMPLQQVRTPVLSMKHLGRKNSASNLRRSDQAAFEEARRYAQSRRVSSPPTIERPSPTMVMFENPMSPKKAVSPAKPPRPPATFNRNDEDDDVQDFPDDTATTLYVPADERPSEDYPRLSSPYVYERPTNGSVESAPTTQNHSIVSSALNLIGGWLFSSGPRSSTFTRPSNVSVADIVSEDQSEVSTLVSEETEGVPRRSLGGNQQARPRLLTPPRKSIHGAKGPLSDAAQRIDDEALEVRSI